MIETEEQLASHISEPFDELAERALGMILSSDEVVISTFPKCGTTWAGQIAHGLRSNGDMNFENLGKVVPWFEMGHRFGHDLSRPQQLQPSLFKSHMALSELPRGGKVINIIRHPGDTLVSYYNFWSNLLFDPARISLEMMARQFFFWIEAKVAPICFDSIISSTWRIFIRSIMAARCYLSVMKT